jgi:hypothetical protein
MFKSFALLLVFASAFALAEEIALAQDDPGCTLQCRNGGQCLTGRPNTAKPGADAKKENRLPDDSHCSCATGYTGSVCEIKYALCEGDQKTCFNGEDCIRNFDGRGKTFYHCQCDAAGSDLSTPEAHQFWYVFYDYICVVCYP